MPETEFILKRALVSMLKGFKRPFVTQDIMDLVFQKLSRQPNTISTYRSYLKVMNNEGIIRSSEWSKYCRSNYYLPHFDDSEQFKYIKFPILTDLTTIDENMRSQLGFHLISSYVKPLDLINMANCYSLLPITANTVINGLKNHFIKEINYEYASSYNAFHGLDYFVVIGYLDRMEYEMKEDEFNIEVDLNIDRKPFMVLSGMSTMEMLRKLSLLCTVNENERFMKQLKMPIQVNIILQDTFDQETLDGIMGMINLRNDVKNSKQSKNIRDFIVKNILKP